MRRPTVLAALAIPLLATAATAAPAKPAKVCQLLADRSADTGVFGAPVDSPSLDVLSADFASSAKNIAGVVRVRALRSDPVTTMGSQYTLYFTVGGQEWSFQAKRQANQPDSFIIKKPGGDINYPQIDGRFDEATNAVYFLAPRKAYPELNKLKVTAMRAVAAVSPPGTSMDTGEGTKPYTDLQPSCLPA